MTPIYLTIYIIIISWLSWIYRCSHVWVHYSYSSVKCEKCEKVKYNPNLATKLLDEYMTENFTFYAKFGATDTMTTAIEKLARNAHKANMAILNLKTAMDKVSDEKR